MARSSERDRPEFNVLVAINFSMIPHQLRHSTGAGDHHGVAAADLLCDPHWHQGSRRRSCRQRERHPMGATIAAEAAVGWRALMGIRSTKLLTEETKMA